MKKWFAACFASVLFAAGTALAEPPADEASAEAAPEEQAAASDEAATPATEEGAEPVDCANLEGDEKTACEAAQAKEEAEAATPAEESTEESKGGKAQRSNKNRMESEYTDE